WGSRREAGRLRGGSRREARRPRGGSYLLTLVLVLSPLAPMGARGSVEEVIVFLKIRYMSTLQLHTAI
ncbi:unnamed protein product, partial [Urochloa humidicola]